MVLSGTTTSSEVGTMAATLKLDTEGTSQTLIIAGD